MAQRRGAERVREGAAAPLISEVISRVKGVSGEAIFCSTPGLGLNLKGRSDMQLGVVANSRQVARFQNFAVGRSG
jgi:hypothetical protein